MYDNNVIPLQELTTAVSGIRPIVDRARASLAQAETAAEVLDAKELADLAYDAVKRAVRLAKAKGAADIAIAAARSLQAEALEIGAAAMCQLADEYDAAQDRREVGQRTGRPKVAPDENDLTPPSAADLGLSRKDIHEARKIRDAEVKEPGFVRRVIGEVVESDGDPSKATLRRALDGKPHVSNNGGNNEWYTPVEFIKAARDVLGDIDLDPASSEVANRVIGAARFFTAENDGLSQKWPAGRIWMNPPYAQPLIGQFAERFAWHMQRHSESSGIVLVNNATETGWFQTLAGTCSAICFPRGRVRFVDMDGNASGAPLQGQALLYFGDHPDAFALAFQDFGFVVFGMTPDGYNPMRWNCERDGCFNIKCRPKIEMFAGCFPGKINFGDIDGMVEVERNFLFMEWKSVGCDLPDGQRIAFEQLTRISQRLIVILVWGNPETMEVHEVAVIRDGKIGKADEIDMPGLQARIKAWSDRQMRFALCPL